MPRAARRDQLLRAAASVFSRRGFHGATVREIAQQSGMLSGSLYAHISTKEDLLYEIVARAARQFIDSVRPIAERTGSAAGRLREALRAHLRVVAGSIEEATVFLHEWKALSGPRREQVQQLRDTYEALWERIIEEGVRTGEFPAVDVKFARLLVLSAANWAYHWFRPDGPLSADEVADRFADLLLRGLGGGTAAKGGSRNGRR